jgi:hypothetical protein
MVQIVNVLRGPIHSSEIPDWDIEDDGFGLPYGEGFVLSVTIRDERGILSEEDLIFQDFDDAVEIVEHFCDQIIPLNWEDTF